MSAQNFLATHEFLNFQLNQSQKLDNINLHVQEIDSKIRRNIEDKQKVDELSDRLRELEGSLNRKSYQHMICCISLLISTRNRMTFHCE